MFRAGKTATALKWDAINGNYQLKLPTIFVDDAKFLALPDDTKALLAPFAQLSKFSYLPALNADSVDMVIHAFRSDSPLRGLLDVEMVKKIVTAICSAVHFDSAAKILFWLSGNPSLTRSLMPAPTLLIELFKPENAPLMNDFMKRDLCVFKMYIIRYMFNQANPQLKLCGIEARHLFLNGSAISLRIQRLYRFIDDLDLVNLADKSAYKLPDGYKLMFNEANLYNVIMQVFFMIDSDRVIHRDYEDKYFMALFNFLMCDPGKVVAELCKYEEITEAMDNIVAIAHRLPYKSLTEEEIDAMFVSGDDDQMAVVNENEETRLSFRK